MEEDRRHPWVQQTIVLTLSPYLVSQGTLAGHPDAQEAPSLACSPPWPAHQPCTRRPRTDSCGCAAACTGHRAHSHPHTGTRRCAGALQPLHCGTARTCKQTHSWLFEARVAPTQTQLCPHVAHRGPTPHRERRVRNQVPVCGNGIRSLATLEVTLTERRKPARDSKGRRAQERGGGVVSKESGPTFGNT